MNRIIKFRAWDIENKVMTIPFGLEETPTYAGDSGGFEVKLENAIVMQFTGLRDKNGKEIYEGDIVRCGEEHGEVQYDEDSAAFIILLYPHNKKRKSGAANLGSTFPSPLKEIIGNVYQTPELNK